MIPNLERIGEVSNPILVVAPTKVKGLRLSCTERAFGPESIIISIRKSSIAEYKYSSTTVLSLCISSMNNTSPSSRLVSKPARSPGFSNTGPEVIFILVPSSLLIIYDKVVLPRPGGPCNKT